MSQTSRVKILPVEFRQKIRTQGLLAYSISLLAHHPCFEHWYYTDHTTTAFINMPNEYQYVFMSQYGDLCALLEHEDYHYPAGGRAEDILEGFQDRIDQGYYIFLESNERHIPGTRAQREGMDFTHTQLVYGYSDSSRQVYMAYYDRLRQYVSGAVSYADVLRAIETAQPFQPMKFYRYKEVPFPLFWKQIAYDFGSYFDNRDVELLEAPGAVRSTGERGVKRLQEYLLLHKERNVFDARAMGTYWENKEVIWDKLLYLQKQGVRFPQGLVERYAPIPDMARRILALYLKFEITRDPRLIDRMIGYMDEVLDLERTIYPQAGACLEEYRIQNQLPY